MKGEHGFCLSNGKRQVLTISQIVWTGLASSIAAWSLIGIALFGQI